jgi:hypothetical protein
MYKGILNLIVVLAVTVSLLTIGLTVAGAVDGVTIDGPLTPLGSAPEDGEPTPLFTDVPTDAWFYKAVKWAVDGDITAGTGSGEFHPNAAVSRASAAVFMYRYAKTPEVKGGASRFTDVPDDAYYKAAVIWADTAGLITGYADGTFKPDAPVTREQLCVMLMRYSDYVEAPFMLTMQYVIFEDEDSISPFAKSAFQALYKLGVISGSGGKVNPKGVVTRAEAVTMLMRFDTALTAAK